MNQRTGALESTILRLFGRRGEVQQVERVGEHFRLITIGGNDLVDRAWTVGDMTQFSFGGWESRAYTPLSYDAARGSLEFLGYMHGNGIGSAWLESLRIGDPCVLVGPRTAVNLDVVTRPAMFFGDETSFSTAAAMRATLHGYRAVSFVFEVTSPENCAPVLDRLGLDEATLFRREADDRHLDALERHVLGAFQPSMRAVFTGKAASIARLYKAARREGISGKQITNVAYWAPGRKGFSGVQR
ncbi:MAG: siderophore-interacting protein [Myxococcales bacterium]|mgnify:CR=1 FL=1|nr:siderophore-interacting protein [Myxococcales bacterium]